LDPSIKTLLLPPQSSRRSNADTLVLLGCLVRLLDRPQQFARDAKMTIALLNRLSHQRDIVETGKRAGASNTASYLGPGGLIRPHSTDRSA
jgi:hypothetical protein